MDTFLFDDFDAISAKQWKQKIQFELQGKEYNESLRYASLEGIHIKPFYTKEDRDDRLQIPSTPNLWKHHVRIVVTDAQKGNTEALNALAQGAEQIYFKITSVSILPEVLFQNIPKATVLYIDTAFLVPSYITSCYEAAQAIGLQCYIWADPIGHLCQTGCWYTHEKEDFAHLETIASLIPNIQSSHGVDMSIYQNSGATMVQQLAYGIAHANEYLHHCTQKQITPFHRTPMLFKVSMGSHYFFEIAKLKALRILWSALRSEYQVQTPCHIIATPSLRNKTIFAPDTNRIRTTVECMSAIYGGADAIGNLNYDVLFNSDSKLATQSALHQLLILKHESGSTPYIDPVKGSFYLESITKQLAEKALSLFKNIEKSGGLIQQLKTGTLQRKIKESAEKEQQLLDNQILTLTGIDFNNPLNNSIPKLKQHPFPSTKKGKTHINPIPIRRFTEKIERKTIKAPNF